MPSEKSYVIGIDTGGTFTDVVAVADDGELFTDKSATTPEDLTVGVLNAIGELAKTMKMTRSELLSHTRAVKHGTTAATNALINRSGSRVGLITSKGFEDTTLIMRAIGRVAGLSEDEIKHQATAVKPKPIVPRELIYGVTERVDFRGNVVIPINMEEARQALRYLIEESKVEALAVNFLFSFMNPSHEMAVKKILKEMYGDNPSFYVSFASELVPVVREYARSNTVILNSYLGKLMETYINRLGKKLAEEGYQYPLLLMQANGGITTRETLSPIATLSSGPAGGMIGSKYMADLLGHQNVITSDMGGTSFDVGLIVDGHWLYAREPVVERFHITWPMIEVESIGAGGGTMAMVDAETRRLRVGPKSAGASPGPVCYSMGGAEPTATDADLVLGLINPNYFLGGRRKLDKTASEKAIRDKIAKPLGMNTLEAAAGIHDVINAHMSDLIRKQVIRAGHTPDECVLYAFGGAGGVHAAGFCEEIGIKQIYVFPTSAVFCAFGIGGADIVHSHTFSYRYAMPAPPETLNARIKEMERALLQAMARAHVEPEKVQFRRTFYMRYRRQLNELDLQVPPKVYTGDDIKDILAMFDKKYEEVYGQGTAYREAGIELISILIDATAPVPKPKLREHPEGTASSAAALKGKRQVYFAGPVKKMIDADIYDYNCLKPANIVTGPAIIETPITTIVIPPNHQAKVDKYLNVVLTPA